MQTAFYDPSLTYDANFENGPALDSLNLRPPKRKVKPGYKFLGFDINLPFGIPAGPLLNAAYVKRAFEWGFDVNVYKTQRSTFFPANDFPNVLYVNVDGDLTLEKAKEPLLGTRQTDKPKQKYSITNSFGNPCMGPELWITDMKKAVTTARKGQLLIASVVGTIKKDFTEEDYFNDFAETASLAHGTGVKAIEVNLSCPNVANEDILCFNPDANERICRKVKEKIGNTPLLVKFGYFAPDQQELLEKIIKQINPLIAGVSVINTIPAPVVNESGDQALPGENRLMSGICGASIKWAGLDMVKRLAALREKLNTEYAIVGVGGVMAVKDFQEYRAAGADLVQSATGAMWNPHIALDIWKREQKLIQVSKKKVKKKSTKSTHSNGIQSGKIA